VDCPSGVYIVQSTHDLASIDPAQGYAEGGEPEKHLAAAMGQMRDCLDAARRTGTLDSAERYKLESAYRNLEWLREESAYPAERPVPPDIAPAEGYREGGEPSAAFLAELRMVFGESGAKYICEDIWAYCHHFWEAGLEQRPVPLDIAAWLTRAHRLDTCPDCRGPMHAHLAALPAVWAREVAAERREGYDQCVRDLTAMELAGVEG
jgi:hypothetical protein